MSDVKWIKIVTDIFGDEKIQLIESLPAGDSILVIWFKLLCMAGRQNNSGVFMLNSRTPYTSKMFATIFRCEESTVQLALKTFEEFGMIEIVENVITIPNWGKYQTLDQLESKKEYMRDYMKEYRAKQKQKALTGGKSTCKTNSKTNVSRAKGEKEKDIEEEKEEEGVCATDTDDEAEKLEYFKGKVMLTESQVGRLLDEMGIEAFNEYVERLDNYIQYKGATIKNHHDTILKWYNEDKQ